MENGDLVFFNTNWDNKYKQESELLRSALKNCFIESHHIGSTAIKNIFSKPKIDIALIVDSLENSKILEKVGYIFRGCLNIPFRYFFSKRSHELNVNLHVLLQENSELEGFIIFRDFLNKNEKFRNEYSELKLKLANLLKSSRNEHLLNKYTLSKNDFIAKILKIAGFKGFCMRLVSHDSEKQYEQSVYGKFKENAVRVIFYKGSELIGYANADEKTKHINFFQVTENENYFKNRLNDYLETL